MKIYLAGKIGVNDWRHDIVDGLHDAEFGSQILRCAIRERHDYTGPFFLNEGHGMTHGDGLHGAGVLTTKWEHDTERMPHNRVFCNAIDGIRTSDVVIAVVEDDAHGTLCEIGYACGIGKKVFVVGGDGKQCWFAQGFAVGGFHSVNYRTMEAALNWCDTEHDRLEFMSRCESPAETAFAEAIWNDNYDRPEKPYCQFETGEYRLDFAFPICKVCIEIDGINFHGNQEAFVKDRKRTRWLESQGWHVMRFAAKEVLPPAPYYEVADEVWAVVSKRLETAHA